jgi:hypothetical protein
MPRVVTVNAATSTLVCLESEVENDGTSVANFELVVVTDSGPQQGIAAANVSLASSRGATDTIVKVDSATNRNGRFRFTVVSSTVGNPVFTATVLGRVITQTATVQFGTVVQPAFEFVSDWSAATGLSEAALRDTARTPSWTTYDNDGLTEIIAATGLDFPTTNVLRVTTSWNGSGSSGSIIRLDESAAVIPVPAVDESIYYRWYFRAAVPSEVSTWGTPHPIQDGFNAADANWEFGARRTGSGLWKPRFNCTGNAWPNDSWILTSDLSTNETYRFEMKLTRTASGTFTMDARIFDDTGSLLYDASDFNNSNASANLSSAPTMTIKNAAELAGLNCGSNGAFQGTTSGDHPFVYCYQGGFAVSVADWCGPYVSGEAV